MKTTYNADKEELKVKRNSILLIVGLFLVVIVMLFWIRGIQNPTLGDKESTRASLTNTTVQSTAAATPTTGHSTTAPIGSDTPKVTEPADTTTAFSGTKKEMSTADIVSLFNKGTNAIKTDAKKVVRNHSKSTLREEYVEIPVFRDMFLDSLKESFTDDMTPAEYDTKELIIEKFPVSGEAVASTLTENEVESAQCKETESEYEITIVLKPNDAPSKGEGVGRAFDIMTSDDAMSEAPEVIKNFSVSYVDCYIKCVLDKKTDRVTHTTYFATAITSVGVDLSIMEVEATMGVAFEDDYSVYY